MKRDEFICWLKNHSKLIYSLVAQILSVMIFVCTYCTDQLDLIHKLNIPTLQTLPTYLFLFLLLSVLSCWRRKTLNANSIKKNWWKYFLYALFDVEANFLIIKSFQYTSPASVSLLDASVIPIVMVLSILVLKYKYRLLHYLGALLTVIGAVSLVVIDVKSDFSVFKKGSNPLVGDLLVLAACACYAISNVITECLVEGNGVGEIIFFQTLFASILVVIQGFSLEYNNLIRIKWNHHSINLLVGFNVALTIFYLIVPSVIKHIGASGFNISLVTTDIYSIIYNAVTYKNMTYLNAIGAIVVTAGCVTFHAQNLYIEYKNRAQHPSSNNIEPNDSVIKNI